jgi:hypothetical protein
LPKKINSIKKCLHFETKFINVWFSC